MSIYGSLKTQVISSFTNSKREKLYVGFPSNFFINSCIKTTTKPWRCWINSSPTMIQTALDCNRQKQLLKFLTLCSLSLVQTKFLTFLKNYDFREDKSMSGGEGQRERMNLKWAPTLSMEPDARLNVTTLGS